MVKLLAIQGETAEKLRIPTVLNWSRELLTVFEDPDRPRFTPLFLDLQMIDARHGLTGNIADAIEVVEIDERPITPEQSTVLWRLCRQKYRSFAHMIATISHIIGKPSVRVVDYKFDVGDNSKKRDSILPLEDVINQALPPHVRQLSRYIVLGTLDWHLAQPDFDPCCWPDKSPVRSGRIQYHIGPLKAPLNWDYRFALDEQERVFQTMFVRNWKLARVASNHRRATNAAVLQLVAAIENGTSSNHGKLSSARQPQLIGFDVPEKRLEAVVKSQHDALDALRDWIGGSEIVETYQTPSGKPVHSMHFDNLLRAMADGTIQVQAGFRHDSGGFICCIHPDHHEETPSLHVDLANGRFHCFGCGFGGRIDPLSVPDSLAIAFNTTSSPGRLRKIDAAGLSEIPENHFEFMEAYQAILAAQFRGSPAQSYLERRGIEVQTATQYGVGYACGTPDIQLLLQNKWSVDMLEHFGVLVRDKNGNLRPAYFSRVTAPLTLTRRPTNIYGRAIGDVEKRYRHRKLSKDKTRVPHGVFNEQALYDYETIIIVESVIDALSLIQLGYPNVVATIGTTNYLGIDLIARSTQHFAIGFNWDAPGGPDSAPGRRETNRVIQYLHDQGYTGEVWDFTRRFIQQHPEFDCCGDFNDILRMQKGL